MTVNIVPEPQKITLGEEKTVFTLTRLAEIEADEKSEKAKAALLNFAEKVFEISFVGTGREIVILKVDPKISQSEGYRLTVSKDCVLVEGADENGVFWGVQSLCALLFQNDRSLSGVVIEDWPAFHYRAFMLDCSSFFFSVEAVKLFLDAMALHKLNVFHWRLTGDQGWRLELFENFLLTQIGAYRAFTELGNVPHGGYYTQSDIGEILAYAHERCISVVPEFDFPDRTAAALCAYPSLGCGEKKVEVATNFKEKNAVLCLGKESTFDFVFSVLDEAAELFGDGVFHLGGGRPVLKARENCHDCGKKAAELSLESTDGLYDYFFERVVSHLEKKKIKAVLSVHGGGCPKGAIVEITKADGGERAENALAVLFEAADLSLPHGVLSVRECLEASPKLVKEKETLGAVASLYTEAVPSMKKAGKQLFPRLGAFSESVWTKEKSYSRFLEKLQDYEKLLSTIPFDFEKKSAAFPSKLREKSDELLLKRLKKKTARLKDSL